MNSIPAYLLSAAVLLFACPAPAQQSAGPASAARQGSLEVIKVHARSLEGNLEGDSPDRDVTVYLPPGYQQANHRFPVIYMLHGFTDDDARWFGRIKHWINLKTVLDEVFADPAQREWIVVMPSALTRYGGSMYSSSVTTGDWETFVANELVEYVDKHYRTVGAASARALAGHSMGGYGAMRIGMKHPDVFSGIYLLSPCCMAPGATPTVNAAMKKNVDAVRTPADIDKADFMTKIVFASAAAWSPNPAKPPFFLDLAIEGGQDQRMIAAKHIANLPLASIDQYIPNLRRMQAIGFDAGDRDEPIATGIRMLDRTLTAYGIEHAFEIYQGDHLNRIAERIRTKVLPFLSQKLK